MSNEVMDIYQAYFNNRSMFQIMNIISIAWEEQETKRMGCFGYSIPQTVKKKITMFANGQDGKLYYTNIW